MFFLISVLGLTNMFIIPYYFTAQFEYFIINYIIPLLNNIYLYKNQKRIIEIKIISESIDNLINISSYEEFNNSLNKLIKNNIDDILTSSEELDDIIEDNDTEDIIEDNDTEDITEDNDTEDITEDNDTEDITEDNDTEDITEDNDTKDITEDNNKVNSESIIIEMVE